jgi:glycosyltransferase involved in cell wall biosynthesis
LKLVVVIAVYNEKEQLESLTNRLIQSLNGMAGSTWRLIYVVEGTDGSKSIADEFARRLSNISVIYGEERTGLGNAFHKGFEAVPDDTDVIVTMDADLNHQPEEIPRLVAKLLSHNVDIVVGSRKVAGSTVVGAPLWKRLLSDVLNRWMKRLMATSIADQTSGFRVYRYSSFRRISYVNTGFAFLPEILVCAKRLNLSIREEPIRFVFRTQGTSKMGLLVTALSYLQFLKNALLSRPPK